jgi:hypothetical protein
MQVLAVYVAVVFHLFVSIASIRVWLEKFSPLKSHSYGQKKRSFGEEAFFLLARYSKGSYNCS